VLFEGLWPGHILSVTCSGMAMKDYGSRRVFPLDICGNTATLGCQTDEGLADLSQATLLCSPGLLISRRWAEREGLPCTLKTLNRFGARIGPELRLMFRSAR
jgi:hypothetical protein